MTKYPKALNTHTHDRIVRFVKNWLRKSINSPFTSGSHSKSGLVCFVYTVIGMTESTGNSKIDSSDLARKKMTLAVETVRRDIQHAYHNHEALYPMI